MADHSMEQDLGLLSMNQKSMVVTIGNIPVDILRAYEAQNLSRFGGQRKRKSKSKSAPVSLCLSWIPTLLCDRRSQIPSRKCLG